MNVGSNLSAAQERRIQRALQLYEARQLRLAEAKADEPPPSKFTPRDVLADPLPFGPNPPPAPSVRSIEIKAAVRRYLEKTR